VDRFNRAVIDAFRRLRDEVGPTWDIYLEIGAQYEHPDLDRYLADPDGFHGHRSARTHTEADTGRVCVVAPLKVASDTSTDWHVRTRAMPPDPRLANVDQPWARQRSRWQQVASTVRRYPLRPGPCGTYVARLLVLLK
jgi:hypothetical protein